MTIPLCEACDKNLPTTEALNQHSNAKHGQRAIAKEMVVKKSNKGKYLVLGIVLTIVVGGYIAFSNSTTSPINLVSARSIDVSGEPTLGSPDAPVIIEGFEDPQCAFCARFTTSILPEIRRNYIDTGKVQFVFRQFPVPNAHPWAIPASVAFECAYVQDEGVFWELHDYVYSKQRSFGSHNIKQQVLDFLGGKDIDIERFTECYDDQLTLNEVNSDFAEGANKGVTGTPTFFINGQKIVGAIPYVQWQQLIEEELRKSGN